MRVWGFRVNGSGLESLLEAKWSKTPVFDNHDDYHYHHCYDYSHHRTINSTKMFWTSADLGYWPSGGAKWGSGV